MIVEAGEQSGSLIQGRAAIEQGRKLFILESCFNRGLNWPEKFLEGGAIRVRNYGDFRGRAHVILTLRLHQPIKRYQRAEPLARRATAS